MALSHTERHRRWRETHREANNENQRRYVARHRERVRTMSRCREHGITMDELQRMRTLQNDLCAICGRPETRKIKNVGCPLVIDHDHSTGKVRGLLCNCCNTAIGMLDDNVMWLRAAEHYLTRGR